jgi:nucleotide-binding universal stress UspA family protein
LQVNQSVGCSTVQRCERADLSLAKTAASSEVVDFEERKLQQLVSQQAWLWCDPTYIVEQGPAVEKILDVAKRRHTDLIVLGARPAKGLATHLNIGTVHKVVSQATCPVLTVRG